VTGATEWLLTGMLNHGSFLLAGALFLSAFGVPLPATLLVMAAGAFTRHGVLAAETAVLAATTAAVAGDACSYWLGRLGLRWAPKSLLAAESWGHTAAQFRRWGGWSVFITRFLLTPAALPVNLLAGSSHYPFTRFMAVVVSGEVLWVLLFGALGHIFAAQWEILARLVGDAVGILVAVGLVAVGATVVVTARKRRANP
jgi:membrane-associated protein